MVPVRIFLLAFVVAVLYRSFRRYTAGCVCTLEGRLDDRVALVLAADTDIGVATVRGLARRGARVIMVCQVLERCDKMRQSLLKEFAYDKAGTISIADVAESKVPEESIPGVSFIRPNQVG